MRRITHYLLVLCAVLATSETVAANIYKCKDAKGSIVFSDAPCATDQSTLDHKVTNDRNTLGRSSSSTPRESTKGKEKSVAAKTAGAPAIASKADSSSGGCDKMRKDFVRQQSDPCVLGIQPLTGEVKCMSDTQRREYLAHKKSVLDAMCSSRRSRHVH
jgi:Domain of unknown function (DUF4124)